MGQIGPIIEIQNLHIALPPEPKELKKGPNKWTVSDYPKELKSIKSIFDWQTYPDEFKARWEAYIDEEFNRRENGFWFYNKDVLNLYYRYALYVLAMVKDRCW